MPLDIIAGKPRLIHSRLIQATGARLEATSSTRLAKLWEGRSALQNGQGAANLLLILIGWIATVRDLRVVNGRNATVHSEGGQLSLGFKKHSLEWSKKQND